MKRNYGGGRDGGQGMVNTVVVREILVVKTTLTLPQVKRGSKND